MEENARKLIELLDTVDDNAPIDGDDRAAVFALVYNSDYSLASGVVDLRAIAPDNGVNVDGELEPEAWKELTAGAAVYYCADFCLIVKPGADVVYYLNEDCRR